MAHRSLSFAWFATLTRRRPKQKAGTPAQKAPVAAAPKRAQKPEKAAPVSAEAEGRRLERLRCAAILTAPGAMRNFALATELAFATDLSAEQAIAILASAPAAPLHNPERAARNPKVAGSPTPIPKEQAIASGWDRAFAKANPAAATQKPRR